MKQSRVLCSRAYSYLCKATWWYFLRQLFHVVIVIWHRCLRYQMKALFVPYHFWLKNYFPAQQIQPLEGDNDTWLLILLQMRNLLEFQIWEEHQRVWSKNGYDAMSLFRVRLVLELDNLSSPSLFHPRVLLERVYHGASCPIVLLSRRWETNMGPVSADSRSHFHRSPNEGNGRWCV